MMKRLAVVLLSLLLCGSALAQVGQIPVYLQPAPSVASGWCSLIPQSGLVNCWPFDTANTTTSVATDVVGGKNATLTNVTLNGSGPSANLNNSGVFNGTSSFGSTTLANVPGSAFSIVTWENATSGAASGSRIVSNDNADQGSVNGFQLWTSGGGLNFSVSIGNGSSSTTATISSAVGAPGWHLLTFTYDGTTLTPYLDGAANGTPVSLAGPVTAGGNNISFGYLQLCTCANFPGTLAGIAIYNRTLTSGEVATINGL